MHRHNERSLEGHTTHGLKTLSPKQTICYRNAQGTVPKGENREGEGLPYHIKGKFFYRIIDR